MQLRALVLTLHDDPAGKVSHTNGGFDFVDVLPAGPACTKRIDPQVFFIDLDLDVVIQFGIHRNGGKRRMATFVGVKRRDPHQTVHTGFRFQIAVGIGTLNTQRGTFDAGFITGLDVDAADLEFFVLGPSHEHPHQHLGPILGFRSAGTGVDTQNGGSTIMLTGQ